MACIKFRFLSSPLLDSERKAKETELSAEKQRIDYEIANSTGAVREQWKLQTSTLAAKERPSRARAGSVKTQPARAYAVAAASPMPSPTPDQRKLKQEYALLESERKAKETALAAEKQRIDYEIAHSTAALRKQWESKLALWRREKQQEEKDQAAAKAALLNPKRQ